MKNVFTLVSLVCHYLCKYAWARPLLLARARLSPTPLFCVQCTCTTKNGFQQIRQFLVYSVVFDDTKILLVKDHARKGKEPIHVKIKVSTCTKFVVGRLNWRRRRRRTRRWTNRWFCQFLYVIVAVYFTYFEGLSGYRNTRRLCVCV